MASLSFRNAAQERRICRVELSRIEPNPFQPRKSFDEDELRSLAESIRQHGLLSPLLVRRSGDGYQLIAGERRLRALMMLGRTHAEALVTPARDCDSALISLIENLQREDLHFLDEAEACRRILREHALSQEELAASLCKSPSALANLLRVHRLSRSVKACIREGGLSERHARALLRLTDETRQLEFARLAASEQLSVRRLEALINECVSSKKNAPERAVSGLIRDNRLVINALRDTVRQLRRIGVSASSRVEEHGDSYDVIVTIRTSREAQ